MSKQPLFIPTVPELIHTEKHTLSSQNSEPASSLFQDLFDCF